MHDMTSSGARGALMRFEVVRVKGGTSGKISMVFRVFEQMNRRGKLRVRYARDVWRTNGLRIRIRLFGLSNFHIQSFSIRATVYFILIFKDLIIFRIYLIILDQHYPE